MDRLQLVGRDDLRRGVAQAGLGERLLLGQPGARAALTPFAAAPAGRISSTNVPRLVARGTRRRTRCDRGRRTRPAAAPPAPTWWPAPPSLRRTRVRSSSTRPVEVTIAGLGIHGPRPTTWRPSTRPGSSRRRWAQVSSSMLARSASPPRTARTLSMWAPVQWTRPGHGRPTADRGGLQADPAGQAVVAVRRHRRFGGDERGELACAGRHEHAAIAVAVGLGQGEGEGADDGDGRPQRRRDRPPAGVADDARRISPVILYVAGPRERQQASTAPARGRRPTAAPTPAAAARTGTSRSRRTAFTAPRSRPRRRPPSTGTAMSASPRRRAVAVAPKPVLAVAPVDPDRRQPDRGGRLVVVVQRLRDVEQLVLGDADRADRVEQGGEVLRARLVGADVLGGDDEVELDAEPLVARGERRPVDVGEDDQLEALLQPGKSLGRVGEGGPRSDRAPERCPLGVGRLRRRGARRCGRASSRGRRGSSAVGCSRSTSVSKRPNVGEQLGARSLRRRGTRPSAELGGDPGLPVDQRAVAVEAEGAEAGELGHHVPFRRRISAEIAGTTSWRSPMTAYPALATMLASGSRLTAMMFFAVIAPTQCWIAPEMPQAR